MATEKIEMAEKIAIEKEKKLLSKKKSKKKGYFLKKKKRQFQEKYRKIISIENERTRNAEENQASTIAFRPFKIF